MLLLRISRDLRLFGLPGDVISDLLHAKGATRMKVTIRVISTSYVQFAYFVRAFRVISTYAVNHVDCVVRDTSRVISTRTVQHMRVSATIRVISLI